MKIQFENVSFRYESRKKAESVSTLNFAIAGGELAFGCENMGYPAAKIRERIHSATAEFGLDELLDRDIFNLSGGEKQKIACGSIYAVNPDIYAFDEPSSNLDFDSINELSEIMKKLKSAGKTIIMIEHRIHYAASMADRIFYMNAGQIAHIFENQEFINLNQTELHQMGLRTVKRSDMDFLCGKKTESSIQAAVNIENLSFRYRRRSHINRALHLQNWLVLPKRSIYTLMNPQVDLTISR